MKSSFLLSLCLTGIFSVSYAQSWLVTGNAIAPGQFIGTTNAQPLSLRTNGQERLNITTAGKIGINNPNPVAALDIYGSLAIRGAGTAWGAAPGLALVSYPQRYEQAAYIALINDKSKKSYDITQGTLCGAPGDNLNIVYYPNREIACADASIPFTVQEDKIGISTNSPTAKLHVTGTVRFQDLQYGTGDYLRIDVNGNIYRSPLGARTSEEKNHEVEALKKEVNDLKQMLRELQTKVNSPEFSANTPALQQNYPNPYTNGTTISYFLPKSVKKAQLLIFDQQGREISTAKLNGRGKQNLSLQNSHLQPGTYFYTLIADGKKIDTKKMLVSR